MSTLMQANHQWTTRPADQRFTSLIDMARHCAAQRAASAASVVPSRHLTVMPTDDNRGLSVAIRGGADEMTPTHWSFGQLAHLAGAPSAYVRALPAPIAADCLNYGLRFDRDVETVGLLSSTTDGQHELRAATGPRYGRIWNTRVVNALIERFGDGRSGQFRVPGEFGRAVTVTTANTTLYASDRDMFVFLADEERRIEIPNRRDGQTGSLARGFYVWNSEVGKSALGVATFLFDYVCCNRIVWGARDYAEVILRHTASAPARFINEIAPALERYAASSTTSLAVAIADAQSHTLDDVTDFLARRYGKRLAATLQDIHVAEEHRPITTRWDVVTAVTAYARSVDHQDHRVELERDAGSLLPAA
ncbi:MAG TPA: hypothetical protein VNW46_19200 [Gemmatimonadaceae bacterium]|nr:hypothetical protein [Gemmatimonadaceae bacterium]